MTKPRMKVITTALAMKPPPGAGRPSFLSSSSELWASMTPLSRDSPIFSTTPAMKPPIRTRPTLIFFMSASLLLVRVRKPPELFGQRRFDSEQPLIDCELAAVVHLMRQCELKHSHFRDLLTVKSSQKLIEFLGAEPCDLFTARSE